MSLKVTQQNNISVYTVSGSGTSRSLPDWLIRKRKRSLKHDEAWLNRIELIQDFEFEEASQCIRVSEDGEYAMATGTYKPQQHIYHLPSSALKYARHTSSLNLTFLLLSTDYTKSLHLQQDRTLEFHTAMGCHYTTRIPRYGRALAYLKPTAHAIIPAEGREVFRMDLEGGRFLKPFEVGGYEGSGAEGDVSSVECVGVAEGSHGLLAFGTDIGTTEFWDPRSRNRVGVLAPPSKTSVYNDAFGNPMTPATTALEFNVNGLTLASGNSAGIITIYDIRSPNPLLTKDHGYGFPIHTLNFLHSSGGRGVEGAYEATGIPKVLSSDKRIIKIWEQESGKAWTSIEPSVDINHVCVVPNSGMIFTANEGQEMHSFLIPALGPSPWWCQHLDAQIEQLADKTVNDPDAYISANGNSDLVTYDNYKFLTKTELKTLNLDHLIGGAAKADGKTSGGSLVRPYMHGYFVDQRLYDEARIIADPFEWERERKRMIKEKIEKDRESRIRTSTKKIPKVKLNKRLAERLTTLEEKLERAKKRKAAEEGEEEEVAGEKRPEIAGGIVTDSRFGKLFQNPDFLVDENSHEFKQLNPSSRPYLKKLQDNDEEEEEELGKIPRGKTAVERENESESDKEQSSDDNDDEEGSESEERHTKKSKTKKTEPQMRISSSSYKKSGHDTRGHHQENKRNNKEKTFASRAAAVSGGKNDSKKSTHRGSGVLGEREITFWASGSKSGRENRKGGGGGGGDAGAEVEKERGGRDGTEQHGRMGGRRSASGNVFRREGLGK